MPVNFYAKNLPGLRDDSLCSALQEIDKVEQQREEASQQKEAQCEPAQKGTTAYFEYVNERLTAKISVIGFALKIPQPDETAKRQLVYFRDYLESRRNLNQSIISELDIMSKSGQQFPSCEKISEGEKAAIKQVDEIFKEIYALQKQMDEAENLRLEAQELTKTNDRLIRNYSAQLAS